MTEPVPEPAEPTVAELLAEADALPEHGTLGATLDAINRTVRDDTVVVTVNLHGKLIGLELSEQAMNLPSADLAERISGATAEAAAAALADGLQAVTDVCGEHIAAAVIDYTGPIVPARPEPPAPAVDTDDEEFAPRSWAIAWDR
ncbi:MAG: hypothetical protein ACRDQB_16915 [Thermocrispum sp.]